MSSQTNASSGRRGRPTKPGRGPHKIGTTADDLLKKQVRTRAAALGMSESDYVHWLVTQDIKANPTEVLLKAAS